MAGFSSKPFRGSLNEIDFSRIIQDVSVLDIGRIFYSAADMIIV
jgi:hypothetical protein